jgi:hypothetical protein
VVFSARERCSGAGIFSKSAGQAIQGAGKLKLEPDRFADRYPRDRASLMVDKRREPQFLALPYTSSRHEGKADKFGLDKRIASRSRFVQGASGKRATEQAHRVGFYIGMPKG